MDLPPGFEKIDLPPGFEIASDHPAAPADHAQIPQGMTSQAAGYLQSHPGMDPQAVQTAFNQLPAANAASAYARKFNMDPAAVRTAMGVAPGTQTTPEQAEREMVAHAAAQRGAIGSGAAEAYHNTLGGIGALVHRAAGSIEQAMGLDQAAEAQRIAAIQAAGLQGNPNHQVANFVGGNAGQIAEQMLPYHAGTVLHGLNTAGLNTEQIQQARDQGQFISAGQALANTGLKTGLDVAQSELFQKLGGGNSAFGRTEGVAAKNLQKIIGNPILSKLAASGGLNFLMGLDTASLDALIDKTTGVNPNANFGVDWDKVKAGGINALLGMGLTGAHEGIARFNASRVPVEGQQNTNTQTNPQQPFQPGPHETLPQKLKNKELTRHEPLVTDHPQQPSAQPEPIHEQNQNVAGGSAAPVEHAPPVPQARPPEVQENAAQQPGGAEGVRPGPEKAEATEPNPARIEGSDQLVEWYKKNNPGDSDASGQALKAMAPDEPYVKAKVPIDQASALTTGEDIDQAKVAKFNAMSEADRAKLPPLVMNDQGQVLDGNHRFTAAQERGDTHVQAYVPESMIGKNGVEAEVATKNEVPTSTEQKPQSDFFARMKEKGAAIGERLKQLPAEESGAATLAASKQFVHQDVLPAAEKIGSGLHDLYTGLRQSFGGQKGAGAEATKSILKKRGAEIAQRMDRFNDQMNKSESAIDRLSVDQQRAITDAAETGQTQATPELQKTADALRAMYDDRLAQIKARDPKFEGIADYMAHAWKQPEKAGQLIADYIARKPLAGSQAFKKQRVFMTQAEGVQAGLEPLSDNPVTTARLKLNQMDKWITAFDARKDIEGMGLLKDEPTNGRVPVGYARVNDPLFRGKIVPEETASVLNNTLSPGIMSHPQFGPALRGLRNTANLMNQASLSVSGIHAVTSSLNSALSEFGLGIKQIAEGSPLSGAKKLGMGATAIGPAARDLFQGSKLLKEWLKPGTTDPQTALIADAMKEQGGRARMDAFYHTGMTDKMMKAFREGNPIGGIVRAPMAGIELAAKPIMEFMVPRLKMGAFMQMAKAELAKNPNLSAKELSGKMGDAWRSVDNRFGEMVQDNRFWNQTARNLASLTFRSVGWNYGTLDEVGGGIKDFTDNLKKIANGDLQNAGFTHRMAYTMALPTLVGMWGAALGYAMTGHAPKSLQDMFFIPTGEKDEQGRDVKLALPTYMKDVLNTAHSPVRTVAGKLHPLVGTVMDMLANKDFYGNKIYEGKGLDVAKDLAKYAGKQALPISLKNYLEGKQQGEKHPLLALGGINQAPKYASESPAEQAAYDLMQGNQGKGRSHEQANRHDAILELEQEVRTHDPHAGQHIQQAVQEQKLTARDAATIRKNATAPGGLKGIIQHGKIDVHDLVSEVWPKMSADEKQQYRLIVRGKIGRSNLTPQEKQELWSKIQ